MSKFVSPVKHHPMNRSNVVPQIVEMSTFHLLPANMSNFDSHPISKSNVWYNSGIGPSLPKFQKDESSKLTILPLMALLFFLLAVCMRCYSWTRVKDCIAIFGQMDYKDDDDVFDDFALESGGINCVVNMPCGSSSEKEAVDHTNAFRLPLNEHTVTSVRSLPTASYDTYRSAVLQRCHDRVYDSVHSYKAFLEQTIKSAEVDIEVELVTDYSPTCSHGNKFQYGVGSLLKEQQSRRLRLRDPPECRSVLAGAKIKSMKARVRHHSSNCQRQNYSHTCSNTFNRRSSPAILEPLIQDTDSMLSVVLSPDNVGEDVFLAPPLPSPCPLYLQSPGSSTSTTSSSPQSGACLSKRRKETGHRCFRRERSKLKMSSGDQLKQSSQKEIAQSGHGEQPQTFQQDELEKLSRLQHDVSHQNDKDVSHLNDKDVSHQNDKDVSPLSRFANVGSVSSLLNSDDSPRSLSLSSGDSSYDVDTDSDVTDARLATDVLANVKWSYCGDEHAEPALSGLLPADDLDRNSTGSFSRSVDRFKVTSLDNAVVLLSGTDNLC